MPSPEQPSADHDRVPETAGSGTSGASQSLSALTLRAFQLRSKHRYALHPIEAALQYHSASTQRSGASCDAAVGFEQAEGHYRAGAQGLRLSEIPQLPQKLRELSRLSVVDRAGRKARRKWATENDQIYDEAEFLCRWTEQGKPGGAEHQVFHDKVSNRWFKRLYYGVNSSTLGDYLVRMRFHAVLFPESAYRLEGFTINPKNKELAPVVSQAHIEVDTTRPLVTKFETDDLMASIGFASIQLIHDGLLDDGYFAYIHPVSGLLVHDLHDENIVRVPETGELAVIDPYISLVRNGTWAAMKLAEVGHPPPDDDVSPNP